MSAVRCRERHPHVEQGHYTSTRRHSMLKIIHIDVVLSQNWENT